MTWSDSGRTDAASRGTDVRTDGLMDAISQLVQGLGLGVTARELRDGPDVPAVFVPLHDDVEGACHRRTEARWAI